MGRSPCCDESGLKKGPWTPEEDEKLVKHIQKHGHGSWRALPKLAGLNRCGKSCRLRWTNYLRPDIKRGKFSQDEEQTILNLHSILGNKWSAIATHLPGRTDNEIKNFWNTHLKKKLIQMGFDPMTHRPRTDIFSTLPHLIALANLKELVLDHQQQQHPSPTNNTFLEEQAVLMRSIQASTEMATLQCYLQYLLQPQPQQQPQPQPSQTTSLPNNMESINLLISSLSSIKDTSNNGSSSSSFSLHDHNNHQAGLLNNLIDSIPFSHLPELSQFPQASKEMINMVQPPADHHHHHDHHYSSLFSTHDQLDNNNNSPNSPNNNNWFASSSSTTPSPPSVLLPRPLGIENTTSSGSSFGGDDHAPSSSAAWPMDILLEDPFFHEIA